MPKQLTPDIVMMRAKARSPEEVSKATLFSLGIEDITCLAIFKNLRVISLTDNHISSLAPLSALPLLEELYIRKNNVSSIEELSYLTNLPRLHKLWISENPLSRNLDSGSFRIHVLTLLPQLSFIDEVAVTESERHQAMSIRQRAEERVKGEPSRPPPNLETPSIAHENKVFKNAGMNILGGEDRFVTDEMKVHLESRLPSGMKQNNQPASEDNPYMCQKNPSPRENRWKADPSPRQNKLAAPRENKWGKGG